MVEILTWGAQRFAQTQAHAATSPLQILKLGGSVLV